MEQKLCRLVYDVFVHFEHCLTSIVITKVQGWNVMGLLMCWSRARSDTIWQDVTPSYCSQYLYSCSFQMKCLVNVFPPKFVVNTTYISVQHLESLSVMQQINIFRKGNFLADTRILKPWQSKCSTEISFLPFPSNQAFIQWLLSQFKLIIDNLKANSKSF